MSNTLEVARAVHILAGIVAGITFWLPWAVGKGSPLHRKAGWAFVVSMGVIAVSGLVVCALRLLDADRSNDAGAIFLAYVSVLSSASASLGVRALRTQRRSGANRHPWDLGIALLLGTTGVAMVVWGLRQGTALSAVFGVLGVVSASGQLRFWLRPPQSKVAHILEHIGGMGAACIATVTAFLVVNARHLGAPSQSLVLWIAPSVIGGVAIALWQRRYAGAGRGGRGSASVMTAAK